MGIKLMLERATLVQRETEGVTLCEDCLAVVWMRCGCVCGDAPLRGVATSCGIRSFALMSGDVQQDVCKKPFVHSY